MTEVSTDLPRSPSLWGTDLFQPDYAETTPLHDDGISGPKYKQTGERLKVRKGTEPKRRRPSSRVTQSSGRNMYYYPGKGNIGCVV